VAIRERLCYIEYHKLQSTPGKAFFFEFLFCFSKGHSRVVRGLHHGPRVDVVQGAARAGFAMTVAHAPREAQVLVAVHAWGNGAVISSRNKRQLAQDVRQGNNIHDRLGRREIQHLGPNVSGAGPPRFGLSGAVIEEGLDQGTLALQQATCVCPDPHLENEINAPVPAIMQGRTEISRSTTIMWGRWDEKTR
jgi:hypothetical protein